MSRASAEISTSSAVYSGESSATPSAMPMPGHVATGASLPARTGEPPFRQRVQPALRGATGEPRVQPEHPGDGQAAGGALDVGEKVPGSFGKRGQAAREGGGARDESSVTVPG